MAIVPIAAGQVPSKPRSRRADSADLLLALTRDEATSQLLASLGVDVTAVRNTLERESPPPD
jgi:hypothetical protein